MSGHCDICDNGSVEPRSCYLCVDAGDDSARFCADCQVCCQDCGETVCAEHAKGKACDRCAMIGYESEAGDGGGGYTESESYREAMRNAGRGHLLRD